MGTGYHCKECGAPAQIVGGKIVRLCTHVGVAVIGSMSATVKSTGKISLGAK